MISFLERFTSKRFPSWSWIPAVLFLVLLIHGALLGLTDDEAYYWVLAQKPALGYAFHPPGVAWSIALSKILFGWLFGPASPAVVRLPAAFFSASVLFMGLRWVELAGGRRLGLGALLLLSFAGVFATSWMMVPDLPLLFGWMLAFLSTWRICFSEKEGRALVGLGAGIVIALLSKYSGVLIAGSAGLAILIWAPRRRVLKSVVVIGLAGLLALLPIVIWNSQHEWLSLLYQFRDRHGGGGGFSLSRFLRFWAIQAVLAGPVLLLFSLLLPGRIWGADFFRARVSRFVLVWALPPMIIFGLQPGWSEFKPHWALIAWLPVALELAWLAATRTPSWWMKLQCGYGWSIAIVGIVLCHFPIGSWLGGKIMGVGQPDPRWDVTNDMYGWLELRSQLSPEEQKMPVIGSRYQTASQAAFALGTGEGATLLPRDLKQRDEWPELNVSDKNGPDWPTLKRSVLFVGDNRYNAPPAFANANCQPLRKIEKRRWGYLAKEILIWRCDPVR